MKLLSIDVETTGLDHTTCGILEVGCVLFDPKPDLATTSWRDRMWKVFECLVDNNSIRGEPYALQMNAGILAEIAGAKGTHLRKIKAGQIAREVFYWLKDCGVDENNKVTIVGKNYDAFDARFLSKLHQWDALIGSLTERRTLDVGSLYFNPSDGGVLGLNDCLERIGIRDEVSHRALSDAAHVATAVSRFF